MKGASNRSTLFETYNIKPSLEVSIQMAENNSKTFIIGIIIFVVLVIGGFAFFAKKDVNVEQTTDETAVTAPAATMEAPAAEATPAPAPESTPAPAAEATPAPAPTTEPAPAEATTAPAEANPVPAPETPAVQSAPNTPAEPTPTPTPADQTEPKAQ
jgi:hypothetical protein